MLFMLHLCRHNIMLLLHLILHLYRHDIMLLLHLDALSLMPQPHAIVPS